MHALKKTLFILPVLVRHRFGGPPRPHRFVFFLQILEVEGIEGGSHLLLYIPCLTDVDIVLSCQSNRQRAVCVALSPSLIVVSETEPHRGSKDRTPTCSFLLHSRLASPTTSHHPCEARSADLAPRSCAVAMSHNCKQLPFPVFGL